MWRSARATRRASSPRISRPRPAPCRGTRLRDDLLLADHGEGDRRIHRGTSVVVHDWRGAPVPHLMLPVASPANASTDIAPSTPLTWAASGNASTYNVAFGTSNPPSVVSTDRLTTTYTPSAAALTQQPTTGRSAKRTAQSGGTSVVVHDERSAPAADADARPIAPHDVEHQHGEESCRHVERR